MQHIETFLLLTWPSNVTTRNVKTIIGNAAGTTWYDWQIIHNNYRFFPSRFDYFGKQKLEVFLKIM